MKYQFKSKRVIKFNKHQERPDYSNLIVVNNVVFNLVGWLGKNDSDISYVMEELTKEMIDKNKYLKSEYVKLISINPNLKLRK